MPKSFCPRFFPQKLTKKQLKKLHKSLPAEFIEMDHSFHAAAGKLADAAEQHDGELVNFIITGCIVSVLIVTQNMPQIGLLV